MNFYETISSLTFATIDLIAFEMLLACIFIVQNDRIKLTFDYLSGLSQFRKTYYYVFPVILLGIIYFYSSNLIQNWFISNLSSTGWKTIPSFILSIGFASFWLTKVTLGRKWNFPLVWGSGIVCVISLILMFI